VRLTGAILLVALIAAAAHPNSADAANADADQIRGMLERMVRASRSLDYIGTFVYRNGSIIRSMKIIHRAAVGGSHERLVALSGAPREVIRDGKRVICIFPDDRAVVVTRRRPGHLYPSATFDPEVALDSAIGEFYILTSDGTDRVADREVDVIRIRPKDRYRYGLRLAVGRETGLLLNMELLEDDSTALEQIVYTHLELPASIPDEVLKPRVSDAGYRRYEARDARDPGSGAGHDSAARAQEWTIGWLPVGFRIKDESYGHIPPGGDVVHHRVYTDGLASLSIFIEPALEAGDRIEGPSSVGAVNAYSRVIDGYQLSVVGEVPAIAVERVAASITKQ